MKRKVKIWYPCWTTCEKEIKVEIPDGEDVEDYLYLNEEQILRDNGCEEDELTRFLDYGCAGVKLID